MSNMPKTCYKSGAHLLELINDVLDLSKIDAGKMELRESIFSVSELIDDAVLSGARPGQEASQAGLWRCRPTSISWPTSG